MTQDDATMILGLVEFLLDGEFRAGGAIDRYENELGVPAAEIGEALQRAGERYGVEDCGFTIDDLHWR